MLMEPQIEIARAVSKQGGQVAIQLFRIDRWGRGISTLSQRSVYVVRRACMYAPGVYRVGGHGVSRHFVQMFQGGIDSLGEYPIEVTPQVVFGWHSFLARLSICALEQVLEFLQELFQGWILWQGRGLWQGSLSYQIG